MGVRTCETCAHWRVTYPTTGRNGECRRYAPRPVYRNASPRLNWPITNPKDWCGEHTPNT